MIAVNETSSITTDLVTVQISASKELWEKISNSEEWRKILNGDVSVMDVEKPPVEETLQSIDSTLKRIEEIICRNQTIHQAGSLKRAVRDVLRDSDSLTFQANLNNRRLFEQTAEQKQP